MIILMELRLTTMALSLMNMAVGYGVGICRQEAAGFGGGRGLAVHGQLPCGEQVSALMDLPVGPGRAGLAMGYQDLQSLTFGPAAGTKDDLK